MTEAGRRSRSTGRVATTIAMAPVLSLSPFHRDCMPRIDDEFVREFVPWAIRALTAAWLLALAL